MWNKYDYLQEELGLLAKCYCDRKTPLPENTFSIEDIPAKPKAGMSY